MARRVWIGLAGGLAIFAVLVMSLGMRLRAAHAEEGVAPQPLTESRLLALIAGNTLPEDLAPRIQKFGLAFTPDANYRALLVSAGADAKVLAAYDAAKAPAPTPAPAAPSANGASASAPPPPAPAKAPVDLKTLQHLADAAPLVAKKQYDDAARAVNEAFAAKVGASDCGYVMGEILRQREDFGRASAVYAKVLEDSPNFPEAQVKLSYLNYSYGDYEESLRLAKSAIASGAGGAEAHKNAALALEGMRKLSAATDEYEEALRIKPNYANAYLDLGNVKLNTGHMNEAIEDYKRAIALEPDEADFHMNLGIAYADLGQNDNAIPELREAKRLNPARLEARNSLGQAYLHSNMFHEAVAEFKELAELNPGSALCHDCYASALFDIWDLDGSEKQYMIAEQLDPSDGRAHVGIGSIRETQKRYDEALVEYRKATELDPTLSDSYWKTA